MTEIQRNTLRVHFTQAEREGASAEGYPYPDVQWQIDGGVLFMRFAGGSTSGNTWDFIFSPSKWAYVEIQ